MGEDIYIFIYIYIWLNSEATNPRRNAGMQRPLSRNHNVNVHLYIHGWATLDGGSRGEAEGLGEGGRIMPQPRHHQHLPRPLNISI